MTAATASRTPPVILLGLDAAEIDVVDRLVAAGRMPNLARLRHLGRWGPGCTGRRGSAWWTSTAGSTAPRTCS